MDNLKKILLAVSGLMAVIPGISLLKSDSIVPDYDISRTVFALMMEVLSTGVLLLLYVNREKFQTYSKQKVTRVSIALMVLFFISVSSYLFVHNYSVKKDYSGRSVVFPLWTAGVLDSMIQAEGSRDKLISDYDLPTVESLKEEMPGIDSAEFAAIFLMLFLFTLIFISLLLLFGIAGFSIKEKVET